MENINQQTKHSSTLAQIPQKNEIQGNVYPHIDIINPDDTKIFLEKYLHKNPVLVKGYFKKSKVVEVWNEEYFLNVAGDTEVEVWQNRSNTSIMTLKKYIEWLIYDQDIEKKENSSLEKENFYLTNFHIDKMKATVANALSNDLNFTPQTFVGKWYLKNWKRNIFLFYGNKNSVTPLHFDFLGTHNTFFQIKGHKKFVILPSDQIKYCYIDIKKSAFSKIDPVNPDYEKYPLLKNITPFQAVLEEGDMLYMPPFTLHYVKGLDLNISMNIDWHSKQSVINSFLSPYNRNLQPHYLNAIAFLGICCGIPNSLLFRFYKSYYNATIE